MNIDIWACIFLCKFLKIKARILTFLITCQYIASTIQTMKQNLRARLLLSNIRHCFCNEWEVTKFYSLFSESISTFKGADAISTNKHVPAPTAIPLSFWSPFKWWHAAESLLICKPVLLADEDPSTKNSFLL